MQANLLTRGSGWCTQLPRMESQRSKEPQLIIQPRSTLSNVVLHFTPCVHSLLKLVHCIPHGGGTGLCSL